VLLGYASRLGTVIGWDVARLACSAPISDDELATIGARIARMGLAASGLQHARDGGRRGWVVLHVLKPLAAFLATQPDDEAWLSWLSLQGEAPEPDGPYPDLTGVLFADATTPFVLAAARSVASAPRRGRKAALAPSCSAYAPVLALFERLPDGAGGTLGGLTDAALRKTVERSRGQL
jgi:hypothetical protein